MKKTVRAVRLFAAALREMVAEAREATLMGEALAKIMGGGRRIPTSGEVVTQCRIEAEQDERNFSRKLTAEQENDVIEACVQEALKYRGKITEATARKLGTTVMIKLVGTSSLTKADGYNIGIGLLAKIKNRIDIPIINHNIGMGRNTYIIEVVLRRRSWRWGPTRECVMTGVKGPEKMRIIWD